MSALIHGMGDPVITPFVKGMMAAGWAPDKNAGGCDLMERCPECQERYVYTFRLDQVEVKACPFCSYHVIAQGAQP
jgi:hypothetical protein